MPPPDDRCWTSVGVVLAPGSPVPLTGWLWLDGGIAIVVALKIFEEGGHLIWQSSQGLMDEAIDPETCRLHQVLQRSPTARTRSSRKGEVYFDSLATRSAGTASFAQVHMHRARPMEPGQSRLPAPPG